MTENINFSIEIFIDELGNSKPSETVSDQQIAAYRGKLPEILLQLWQEQGWGSYGEGLFWTVNPADYHEVLQQWLVDTRYENEPDNYVFARSAFGELFIWNSKKGKRFELAIHNHWLIPGPSPLSKNSAELKQAMENFFATTEIEELDIRDDNNKHMFKRALKKLGPLQSHEMYGFVPAVCLGGPMLLENLQKVAIVEHLSILANLTPTVIFK